MQREVFGVIWIDNMLGPLTLTKPDAKSAIESAKSMREKGADKIKDCHAVHIAQGSDKLVYLD